MFSVGLMFSGVNVMNVMNVMNVTNVTNVMNVTRDGHGNHSPSILGDGLLSVFARNKSVTNVT